MKPSPWNRAALFFLGLPEAADDEPLDRMLGLAEATPLCAISVAGPEAGDAISGLWRRGYQRVEAARRATCPSADERCDVRLVVGCEHAESAAALAANTAAMLRPGGALVVDASRMVSADARRTLCRLLDGYGFACAEGAHLGAEIKAERRPTAPRLRVVD